MEKNRKITGLTGSSRIAFVLCLTLGLGLIVVSSIGAGGMPQDQPKPSSQYPGLPDGPGKDTLVRVCSSCHTPTVVIANSQSRQGWEDTITKMVGMGASGSDADFTEILDYLVKNFPAKDATTATEAKINMNKATAADLQTQLGFTAADAKAIVAYRDKSGPFKGAEDVKKVPALDAKEIDSRKDRMIFE